MISQKRFFPTYMDVKADSGAGHSVRKSVWREFKCEVLLNPFWGHRENKVR